jgi:CheY-like chemotaxis protein
MCKLNAHNKISVNEQPERAKILVIDDDQLIRDNMKRLLSGVVRKFNLDIDIIEGSDGLDLVDLVNDDTENLIRLIFTDENMAQLDGSEAIRRIREIKKMNNIKVISITSLDDLISVQRILESGADKVLTKPARRVQLEDLVKTYL